MGKLKYMGAVLVVAIYSATSAVAETIQLGGDSAVRTAGWLDLVGESGVNNVQPISYTDTNGITFTVTASANSGQNVAVLNTGLAVYGGIHDARIDTSESLELTLSISGGTLESLSASFFVESLLAGEGFDVTDGAGTVVIAELADHLVGYGAGQELDGLTPLTESNGSTWSIQFSPNSAYPDTKGLLGALILDYTIAPPLNPLYADADLFYRNTNTYNIAEETYVFSELWSTSVQPNLNFLPEFYNSPIVTRGDDTFVLFIDPDHRLKVAHLTNGVFKAEAFVDNTLYQPDEFYANHDDDPANDVSAPDYHRFKFEDAHHSASLGIDENGYLHLVGDMHNYPRYESSMAHLPLRYFDKNIMYWRSDNPLDISSFSFKGDQAGECPAGSGFTYQYFFNDLNGKLFMSSRGQQSYYDGTRCATYSSYDAGAGQWAIIGGAPDPSDANSIPCTFYDDGWEYDLDGGTTNSSGKYSKLRPHGVFDRQNNMHLATSMLRDPTFNPVGMGNGFHFADSMIYAQSVDGGETFTSVGGRGFTLPATVNLTDNRAELVFGEPGDYLSANTYIAVDYMNRPFTCSQWRDSPTSSSENVLLGWDGSSWVNYGNITTEGGDFRLVNDPAGVMSYISDGANVLYRFWNPTNLYEVTTPWAMRVIDYEYQKKTGNLMGLAKNTAGEMAVVKVEINNRPELALINVQEEIPTNLPPEITVQATINGYTLSVEASDADSDPLTYTWSKSYGPGYVLFPQNGTAGSSSMTLSINETGTYEFKVSVSDGIDTRISTCTAYLLISSPEIPQVVDEASASPDTIILQETTFLSVAATNVAAGGTAIFTWSKSSGPGDVSFTVNGTAASSNTVASFNAIGTYGLKVTITNNAGTALSSCTVTTVTGDIAYDDFQSNDWVGGAGWDGPWTVTTGGDAPPDFRELSGNYAARLRDGRNSQSITRTLAGGIANGTLTFKWDADSLDSSEEYGYAEVYDGTWHIAWSVNNSGNGTDTVNLPDNLQTASLNLGAYGIVTQIRFRTSDNTGTGDYFFIDDVEISAQPYTLWSADNILSGPDAEYTADPDGDGISNLGEYALGGNPNTNDVAEIHPIHSMTGANGINWFNYIYNRRRDAAARNLTYEVQTSTNLVSNIWTNNSEEAGSTTLNAYFESVTNRVPCNGKPQQFLRLEIGISE